MFGGANPRQIPIVKTQKQKQNSCLLKNDVHIWCERDILSFWSVNEYSPRGVVVRVESYVLKKTIQIRVRFKFIINHFLVIHCSSQPCRVQDSAPANFHHHIIPRIWIIWFLAVISLARVWSLSCLSRNLRRSIMGVVVPVCRTFRRVSIPIDFNAYVGGLPLLFHSVLLLLKRGGRKSPN